MIYPVERDGANREITLIPGAEAPTRIAKGLSRMLAATMLVGADQHTAWEIIERIALDCLPATRRRILEMFRVQPGAYLSTTEIGTALGYPTTTARRSLEELTAYKLLERFSEGSGKADRWAETEWTVAVRGIAFAPMAVRTRNVGMESV